MLDQLRRKRNARTTSLAAGHLLAPYTVAEKREMDAALYRKPHSGPYVVVYPCALCEGPIRPGYASDLHNEERTRTAHD